MDDCGAPWNSGESLDPTAALDPTSAEMGMLGMLDDADVTASSNPVLQDPSLLTELVVLGSNAGPTTPASMLMLSGGKPIEYDEKKLREQAAAEVAAMTKKDNRGTKRKLTPEERQQQNRDRNREHARNTRLRKKAYMVKLKELVDKLRGERDREDRERLMWTTRFQRQAEIRRKVAEVFLNMRLDETADRSKFSSILDENCSITLPITPFRSFNPTEIVASSRVLVGIDAVLRDARSIAVMVENIGSKRIEWCKHKLEGHKIGASFTIEPSDVLQAADILMCTWTFCTTNAVTCGAATECFQQGMIQCKFNAQNKIMSAAIIFDAMGFMQQLQRSSSDDSELPLVVNTLATAMSQHRANGANLVFGADDGLRIQSVSREWTVVTGQSQESIEGKSFLDVVKGLFARSHAGEDIDQRLSARQAEAADGSLKHGTSRDDLSASKQGVEEACKLEMGPDEPPLVAVTNGKIITSVREGRAFTAMVPLLGGKRENAPIEGATGTTKLKGREGFFLSLYPLISDGSDEIKHFQCSLQYLGSNLHYFDVCKFGIGELSQESGSNAGSTGLGSGSGSGQDTGSGSEGTGHGGNSGNESGDFSSVLRSAQGAEEAARGSTSGSTVATSNSAGSSNWSLSKMGAIENAGNLASAIGLTPTITRQLAKRGRERTKEKLQKYDLRPDLAKHALDALDVEDGKPSRSASPSDALILPPPEDNVGDVQATGEVINNTKQLPFNVLPTSLGISLNPPSGESIDAESQKILEMGSGKTSGLGTDVTGPASMRKYPTGADLELGSPAGAVPDPLAHLKR